MITELQADIECTDGVDLSHFFGGKSLEERFETLTIDEYNKLCDIMN